jgi:hypothetical protein
MFPQHAHFWLLCWHEWGLEFRARSKVFRDQSKRMTDGHNIQHAWVTRNKKKNTKFWSPPTCRKYCLAKGGSNKRPVIIWP